MNSKKVTTKSKLGVEKKETSNKLFLISGALKNLNLLVPFLILILDQIIKQTVRTTNPLIKLGFITIHHVTNTGASFGILKEQNILLSWVTIIAIGALIAYQDKFKEKSKKGIFLVIAGAISNLLDRIILGSVIDYIDLSYWPVFNIADSMIVVGVGLILLYEFKK